MVHRASCSLSPRAPVSWVSLCLTTMLLWSILGCHTGLLSANSGATYYVDGANGRDANPGTKDQPWQTLTKANETLRPGDTVLIRAGVYNDVIAPKRSGEPGQRITYTRYGNEQVVVQGTPAASAIVTINRSYIVVDGLEIRYGHNNNGPRWRRQRWAWVSINGENATHNEIRNLRMVRDGDPTTLYRDGYFDRAIAISRAKHNLITGNYIRGLNQGIHINQAAQYNRILNNHITETSQSAIVVGSSSGVMQGNLIEGNVLERSGIEDGIQFMPDYQAVNLPSDISNFGTVVRNNIIRYNAENAIDLKGAAYVVIEGNIIYGSIGSSNGGLNGWNRNALAAISRGKDTSVSDIIVRRNILYDNANGVRVYDRYKVYNNTILFNNRDYEGSESAWEPRGSANFAGIAERDKGTARLGIKNNIVGGHRNAGEIVVRVSGSSDLDIDYNLYFHPDHLQFLDFRTTGNMQAYAFDEWLTFLANHRGVIGNEENSLVVSDPRLTYGQGFPAGELDPRDFDPLPDSPVVNRGGPLTFAMSAGSGREIQVEDAGYFFDGYGIVSADWIRVGDNPPARIVAIDYARDRITLDRALDWAKDDWVTLPYNGDAPDIGARELGGNPLPGDFTFAAFLPLVSSFR